ncbi:3D domain-containing protein [Paenibacillus sp. YN15]|uniref:3D domain-containing protein n=1 Tax=Paenibacillus sp. YN15 TaxID=1742774 RepID=UPI0015EC6115
MRKTHTDADGRRIVATDPDVIPLGTALEIRLADGSVIEAIAADKGGRIRGKRIDVLHRTYAGAVEFGRQNVEVRIITKNEEETIYERKIPRG